MSPWKSLLTWNNFCRRNENVLYQGNAILCDALQLILRCHNYLSFASCILSSSYISKESCSSNTKCNIKSQETHKDFCSIVRHWNEKKKKALLISGMRAFIFYVEWCKLLGSEKKKETEEKVRYKCVLLALIKIFSFLWQDSNLQWVTKTLW